MAKSLSITGVNNEVRVFQCPKCKETINTSLQQCPFCATPIDFRAAQAAAEIMDRVNQGCSDASYLRIIAGMMLACFGLSFVPVLGNIAVLGLTFLVFAVPVMAIRWWVKFGAVRADDSEFCRAKRTTMVAVGIWAIFPLAAGLWLGAVCVSRQPQLVVRREAIRTAWPQVDFVLQRRADLIPNLVETAKGFAAQERAVFDSIAQAHAAMAGARTPAQRIAANDQLSSALSRLLVVVENYPRLKSNENFLRLQDELALTEYGIAMERRKYNEVVQAYNTSIQLFPNNLVASVFGFQREPIVP